jgi:hypothetical protein
MSVRISSSILLLLFTIFTRWTRVQARHRVHGHVRFLTSVARSCRCTPTLRRHATWRTSHAAVSTRTKTLTWAISITSSHSRAAPHGTLRISCHLVLFLHCAHISRVCSQQNLVIIIFILHIKKKNIYYTTSTKNYIWDYKILNIIYLYVYDMLVSTQTIVINFSWNKPRMNCKIYCFIYLNIFTS